MIIKEILYELYQIEDSAEVFNRDPKDIKREISKLIIKIEAEKDNQ